MKRIIMFCTTSFNQSISCAFVTGGGTTLGVLKGEDNPVKKEGIGDLSSSGASSSGLGLQSLLGAAQADLKPKPTYSAQHFPPQVSVV